MAKFHEVIGTDLVEYGKMVGAGPMNSIAYKISALLDILDQEDQMSAEDAHKLADRIKDLPAQLSAVFRIDIEQKAGKVISRLKARVDQPQESLLAGRARGIALAMEDLDPDEEEEDRLEMEDPHNSKRYGPKTPDSDASR